MKENKNKFKIYKLLLYMHYLKFILLILILNNFKIYKFLTNFNYSWFSFIFFIWKNRT